MTIRKSRIEDIEAMQSVYEYARKFMKETGNPNQWKDDKPYLKDLINDIDNGNSYIIEENDEIAGVFSFIEGEDKTYLYIEDGKWLNDNPYGTIHRIASNGKMKNVFETALNYCLNRCSDIRIDTHQDNKVMQHKLQKNGFVRCGIIYLEDGESRIAFQLSNREE